MIEIDAYQPRLIQRLIQFVKDDHDPELTPCIFGRTVVFNSFMIVWFIMFAIVPAAYVMYNSRFDAANFLSLMITLAIVVAVFRFIMTTVFGFKFDVLVWVGAGLVVLGGLLFDGPSLVVAGVVVMCLDRLRVFINENDYQINVSMFEVIEI